MYKAELVVYIDDYYFREESYETGNFRQASIIGKSEVSYEDALEDAYKVAFDKYGVTSDSIKKVNRVISRSHQNKTKRGFHV
jgi:hypothetical protein